MTVIPRVLAAVAILASVLPFAAATETCQPHEFLYENKSCCVPKGSPPSPPPPPSGKSCPSSNSANWYWSDDKACCLPSSAPPPGNPEPSCPKGHSWNPFDSFCSPPPESNCNDGEWWFDDKKCCLPYGGIPSPPPPPRGSQCPPSGWYWHPEKSCCVPHTPPSAPPQCTFGWEWIFPIFSCQPLPTPPSTPPSKPSGVHYKKRTHKARNNQLCPTGLSACPVTGLTNNVTSDYECIDTQQELESCGGCSSVGAGQDCTAIPGAWNVGCAAGSCAVYNCMAGFRLSLDGKSCIAL
ncbi:hypothetical protein BV25DRAFT_1911353 [Artomyces pyxidatus]|uniref:Uncharacterized protein n=1 Tax=Artomyces pyxidatus TaxID=48021 RepID=A0ACB8TIY8_9AGAM|nr:hypothetical protein BV25DRAFT_1911353 [Artomyces pyxidatus]